jgi:hypothetical protein
MEDDDDDDDEDNTTRTTRRSRTTLPKQGLPFRRRSYDVGLNYSATNTKGKKIVKR